MTSFAKSKATDAVEYPSSDGKPMAETEVHLRNMFDVIAALTEHYRKAANVYVAGNMLMFYVPGNKLKHVSPDVFVVLGLYKHLRDNYLIWEEGKAPDFVIELTSASTRNEDQEKKFKLYRDTFKVKEYFLFDPKAEYLSPSLQGYRLTAGRYAKIRPVKGRLPSRVLGLHLERDGYWLRLFDPACNERLRTPAEEVLAREQEALARQQAEVEVVKLRSELQALRTNEGTQS